MTTDDKATAPTRDQVLQYIVDDRAMGCGWQPIANSLNAAGLVDLDGARWSAKRAQRAYDAHPDKTPSYCRSAPSTVTNPLTDLIGAHNEEDPLWALPDTVVGRRGLWHWVKGTKP